MPAWMEYLYDLYLVPVLFFPFRLRLFQKSCASDLMQNPFRYIVRGNPPTLLLRLQIPFSHSERFVQSQPVFAVTMAPHLVAKGEKTNPFSNVECYLLDESKP